MHFITQSENIEYSSQISWSKKKTKILPSTFFSVLRFDFQTTLVTVCAEGISYPRCFLQHNDFQRQKNSSYCKMQLRCIHRVFLLNRSQLCASMLRVALIDQSHGWHFWYLKYLPFIPTRNLQHASWELSQMTEIPAVKQQLSRFLRQNQIFWLFLLDIFILLGFFFGSGRKIILSLISDLLWVTRSESNLMENESHTTALPITTTSSG